jgi:phosphoribosylglycinamide formyltransferase-1
MQTYYEITPIFTAMNIAIFASSTGTNALKLLQNEKLQPLIKCIVTNKPQAGVVQVAKQFNKPVLVVTKESFFASNQALHELQLWQINFIILAGFLWKIPEVFVQTFPNKIINIHPALLPKFGGKGMYGMYVHKAVVNNKETETGITIHYVNENYDEGQIIAQYTCVVSATDTAEMVSNKVQQLEHRYFVEVVKQLVL